MLGSVIVGADQEVVLQKRPDRDKPTLEIVGVQSHDHYRCPKCGCERYFQRYFRDSGNNFAAGNRACWDRLHESPGPGKFRVVEVEPAEVSS